MTKQNGYDGMGEVMGGQYCTKDFHAYPKTYAGNPQYAAQYLNRCLCGKKKRVTTVKEVDV